MCGVYFLVVNILLAKRCDISKKMHKIKMNMIVIDNLDIWYANVCVSAKRVARRAAIARAKP